MPNPRVSDLADAVRASDPLLGVTRLVVVDGPAGSGKTTLANRLAVALGGTAYAGAGTYDPARATPADAPVQVLHGDDMYEGWGGLATLDRILVDGVLEPLARGDSGQFRMWDWLAGRRTHRIPVPARPFLVIEGVGVAARSARRYASVVVFVDAPWEIRRARGLARDGEAMRDEWERWHVAEEAHFAAERTRASAAFLVDGTQPVAD